MQRWLLGLLVAFSEVTAQAQWLDGWQYRKEITVGTVTGGPHADFPLLIALDADAGLMAHAKPDLSDVRVTTDDGETTIPIDIVPPATGIASPLGATTWFNSPQSIKSNDGTKLLVGWVNRAGDVGVDTYTYATDAWTTFTLKAALQADDHNNPGIIHLADGHFLACYSSHGTGVAASRRSTNPNDTTAWDAEVAITDEVNDAYADLWQLDDGTVYWMFRRDSGIDRPRYIRTSTDGGVTWPDNEVKFFDVPNQRPYTKCAINGTDRVDFSFSTSQPSETPASIYHFYMQLDGSNNRKYYKSDGTEITRSGGTISGDALLPITPSDCTLVWDGATANSWNWDTCIVDGSPVLTFVTFTSSNTVHTYYQARLVSGSWVVDEICGGGDSATADYLYSGESHYSGGVVTNPNDINVVAVSREISGTHQIQRWEHTGTFGSGSWAKVDDLTSTTGGKAFRPYYVRGAAETDDYPLLWVKGSYTGYTDYLTGIQGLRADWRKKIRVYAKVPSLSTGQTLFVYYGNDAASSVSSSTGVWGDWFASSHMVDPLDGSGVLPDLSGNSRPITKVDYARLAPSPGQPGPLTASQFSPGTTGFNGTMSLPIQGRTSLTVSAWVRPTSLSSNRAIVSSWTGTVAEANILLRTSTTNISGLLIEEANTQRGGNATGITPTTNAWQRIDMIFDTTNGIQFLRNGVLSSNSFACSTLDATAPGTVYIGEDRGSNFFTGNIGPVRFHGSRLSPDYLKTSYDAEVPGSTFLTFAEEEEQEADTTPPELVSATIGADGDTITLVFDEAVTGNAGFTLNASGGAVTMTYASGSGTDTLVYNLSRPILQGETVTLTYTP